MAELDTSARNQPADPPPGQEIDPDKLDNSNSYPVRRSGGEAPPDLYALTGGKDARALTGTLADLQRRKVSTDNAIDTETERRLNEDRERMNRAFQAEGAGINDIRPWNAAEEHKKYETNAIESFGSLASVFAIVASAFTHAPMANALNGSAAAMNAIREGKEEDYKRSYDAFKTNMDLAKHRFDMQHQLYSDATALMSTDATLGRVKLENAARRFGDQKVLAMLSAGMDKEVYDLLAARDKQMVGAYQASEAMTRQSLQEQVLKTDPMFNITPQQEPNPMKRAAMKLEAFNRAHFIANPTDQVSELMGQYILEHLSDNDGKGPTAEQLAKFRRESETKLYGTGGTGIHVEADFVQKRVAELTTEHPEMSQAERIATAEREWAQAKKSGITGNRVEQLEAHVGQYESAIKIIDKVTTTLDKYTGAAGAAGKVTRMGERIGNLAGSNQTDRVQMMRDISELQLLAPRLLLDQSTGRPLSAEAGHINDVIAGLNAGDTTANTLRAMKEIRRQLNDLMTRQKARLGPKGGAAVAPPAAEPEAPAAEWWKNDPVVK